ncbi:hypothetical protein OSTOST_09179, partial [Ostertagia ostertagi]
IDFKIIVTGQDSDRQKRKSGGKTLGNAAYSLHDKGCKIPKLDINGSEVKSFFFKPEPLKCHKNPTNWVYIDDKNQVQYIGARKNAKCHGNYVTRKDDHNNNFSPFNSLPSGKPLKSDFAVVQCQDGKEKWNGILMSVVRQDKSQLLMKNATSAPDNSGLSIFFLGFDSLSHMSFIRKMPKTLEVLEKSLGSVVLNGECVYSWVTFSAQSVSLLQGYNIVGDGTPPSFYTDSHSFDGRRAPTDKKTFFLTRTTSTTCTRVYTYRLKGFRKKPTDHYLRPIFKEYEKTGGLCLGSEPLHKAWFRYAREFMRVYRDMPRFLLMHQGLLSHDDINLIEVEDEDVAEVLKTMHKNGELDNALVIVMADHGHRFAKLRETHQGQLEERLPFFSIALPAAFRKTAHGKKMYENLKRNKDRLRLPFFSIALPAAFRKTAHGKKMYENLKRNKD